MERDTIRISVRNLVEFLMRGGNIDNRRQGNKENAMQEGSRIHRMIQKRMGSNYHAEVFLRHQVSFDEYDVVIEGRADGILIEEPPPARPGLPDSGQQTEERIEPLVTVDEIKGIFQELSALQEPVPVHLAQAKCYAYIYACREKLSGIRVRMSYCHIETEQMRYFHEEYTFHELECWFTDMMAEYKKWADFQHQWRIRRNASIKEVAFPFPYREGQKELAAGVYRTIYHKKKLFIQAPTGTGKTISTVFPAVKAVGEGLGEKIFYLTAKTITRTVAAEAFQLLEQQGLSYKTLIITARDKACFLGEPNCNPEACPFAKGHYDRVNDALYEILTKENTCYRDTIEAYAEKYQVCPFEMCLDMSLFADAIICDYNYVFDPNVYLKRFFAEGIQGDYIFLIDEAHNLVERGREMYSATLYKEAFLSLKRIVKEFDGKLARYLETCNKHMLEWKRQYEKLTVLSSTGAFSISLMRVMSQMEKILEKECPKEISEPLLDLYFEIRHFLNMEEILDDNYVTYVEEDELGFKVKLFCVNPAKNLDKCLSKGNSSILFSATLLPLPYYRALLSVEEDDYAVYARSNFAQSRRGLFIGRDVSSKYTRRGQMEYYNICSYIAQIVGQKRGNYLIFFPSHVFLREVYQCFVEYFADDGMELAVQHAGMSEGEREAFLDRFLAGGGEDNAGLIDFSGLIDMPVEIEEDRSLLGFCVMGGIFGEGIDLKRDSLIGTIIVGTGLPQVCGERELLKEYFNERGMDGFDYAYRYPGMNKVLQAAGRVIRTSEDIGVIALLDERFLGRSYQKMFPREWEHFQVCDMGTIKEQVARFWRGWEGRQ